ncbi:hypothetical protein BDU57DRAFT_521583 [Ampelomyces quisqualis]|uniref:Uncharacterized protein n=1 Tax=Ampelomyces quisqualis TaxID=50730 RepID=A0A6A5QEP0_AMPQU|nr:hypothetical protein BDU57DRAFT_521583 [Ampelomyces quisqualis]
MGGGLFSMVCVRSRVGYISAGSKKKFTREFHRRRWFCGSRVWSRSSCLCALLSRLHARSIHGATEYEAVVYGRCPHCGPRKYATRRPALGTRGRTVTWRCEGPGGCSEQVRANVYGVGRSRRESRLLHTQDDRQHGRRKQNCHDHGQK